MRILLLTHSFNSLTQRLFVELRERGHEVSVEFDIKGSVAEEALALARPDLIIAPFLKRAIPDSLWRSHVCLVVHPGPAGDRGPSALDWAILEGRPDWGVTVLQAEAEMDAGPVWEEVRFPMRAASKSSLYRNEVTEAAVDAVLRCVARFPEAKASRPPSCPMKPAVRPADRRIDWSRDGTADVLRKIRSADGVPGLLDSLFGRACTLHDAHEAALSGAPGTVVARSGEALGIATRDGGVWIGRVRLKEGDHPLKLPAAGLFAEAAALPEVPGWCDLGYEEDGAVGYLHFPFHNGAMSTGQCHRLRQAYAEACRRDTKVLVLMGGPDFWCNGIHLNTIEADASPAEESWRNINAIDDLTRDIITTTSRLVVAAVRGNAGAGGVFLALAADLVWARDGVVLNPHYKGMGNLYGSEYWTYLLPRRAGPEQATAITQARLPVGTAEAKRLGLIDDHFGADHEAFVAELKRRAQALASAPDLAGRLARKARDREEDQRRRPLEEYRRQELEHMKLNFFGFDPSYHVARYNFVHKVPKSRTPLYLASHRRKPAPAG